MVFSWWFNGWDFFLVVEWDVNGILMASNGDTTYQLFWVGYYSKPLLVDDWFGDCTTQRIRR
jgi:hypothetical protein